MTSSTANQVGVVILNWNQPEMTGKCLDYVFAQEGVRAKVLVVDNGSRSENGLALERLVYGRCEVLWLPRNIGFAGGMNAGIRHALQNNPDFIWLLNNDAFPSPDCLVQLVAAMQQDERLASVTPFLNRPDGSVQPPGGHLTLEPFVNKFLTAEELAVPVSQGYWLTGTALLVRASVLKTHLLDLRYFAYWEDVDLHLVLCRSGHYFRAVPTAMCCHHEGFSSGGSESPFHHYFITRNKCLLMRKHLPLLAGVAACMGFLGGALYHVGTSGQAFTARTRVLIGVVWSVFTGQYYGPKSLYAPAWFEWLILWRVLLSARLICAASKRFDYFARFTNRSQAS